MATAGQTRTAPEGAVVAPEDEARRPARARVAWRDPSSWERGHWLLAAAIVAGLVARIVHWAVAGRRIDDAMITIKHDKNVADGVGLVHNLGDGTVHGFTSALSVLVPLPGELIATDGGFFLIRLVSLAAFVVTAVYAFRICRELGLGLWPIGFVLAFLALDENQVFYGMAGMETQIAVAVLLVGVYYVLVEDYIRSGIALGLAPLARPDYVLWAGAAYLFLFLRNRRLALRAALISALVLAPWLVFTTLYYGSPVPNTVGAKSNAWGPDLPGFTQIGLWVEFLGDRLSDHQRDWRNVAPFLEKAFVQATPLATGILQAVALTVVGLAIVGGVATWSRKAFRPAIAFLVLWLLYKLIFLTVGFFEWYGPPAMAIMVILAAAGLDRVARWVAGALRGRLPIRAAHVAAVPAVLLAVAYGMQLPYTIPLEARVQHDIEDKVRVELGKYLGRVVQPGQSVTSESSGYAGYWTNATWYDFPGLQSPTVVETLKEAGAKSWATGAPVRELASPQLITKLMRPDWVVLRPHEHAALRALFPETAAQYRPARRFGVTVADTPLRRGGLVLGNPDRQFVVLRRTGG